MTPPLRTKRTIGLLLTATGQIAWYAGLTAAVGTAISQLIQWLEAGQWTTITTADALQWSVLRVLGGADSAALTSWLYEPKTWLGLHRLVTMTSAFAVFLAVAIAGALIAGRGRAMQVIADRAITETERLQNFAQAPYQASQPAAKVELPPTRTQLTTTELDILRWLALNGADSAVVTPEAIGRHLRLPTSDINNALVALTRLGYARTHSGRAELSELGLMFCIEQGWTMAT